MRNIKVREAEGKLVITVDTSGKALKNAPKSKSGKSKLLASTDGWWKSEKIDGLSFNMNVSYKE